MWASMVTISFNGFWYFSFFSNDNVLWQSSGHSHIAKSSVSRTHKTHWVRLSFYPWKNLESIIDSPLHPVFIPNYWHLHQTDWQGSILSSDTQFGRSWHSLSNLRGSLRIQDSHNSQDSQDINPTPTQTWSPTPTLTWNPSPHQTWSLTQIPLRLILELFVVILLCFYLILPLTCCNYLLIL